MNLPTFSVFIFSFLLILLNGSMIHLTAKEKYLTSSCGFTSICSNTDGEKGLQNRSVT